MVKGILYTLLLNIQHYVVYNSIYYTILIFCLKIGQFEHICSYDILMINNGKQLMHYIVRLNVNAN